MTFFSRLTASLLIFGSLAIGAPGFLFAEGRQLIFGRVQDDPVRAIQDRQEFVDYIAKKLAPLGISGGRISVFDKIHLLTQAVREGRVDFFHDSIVPVMVVAHATGAVPILRQWKYSEAEYESVIIVKKNSGIESLTDLRGKVIAFEEPHSTSASVLPRMLLEEKKLKLVQLQSPGPVKPDVIGYVYSGDGNSHNFLITGKADAAATTLREIDRLKPEIRDGLQVIAKSESVPRLLIAVRKDLDPRITAALKEIMLNMDQSAEGQGVLKRQQNTTKIDAIPQASHKRLANIEKFVFSSLGKEVDSW
ncbi:MAG TPA: phosphate/phosphite/phosphonate ABC transporter substrate-binding protein [Verrucomicrobiae bacterium]|jgi:phosphonate transport system substrate-binding protein|nr:phosphate/phosphite/phosphonate ABC transporter substrate-binding protein [Verrucomicrobiae bacterium]